MRQVDYDTITVNVPTAGASVLIYIACYLTAHAWTMHSSTSTVYLCGINVVLREIYFSASVSTLAEAITLETLLSASVYAEKCSTVRCSFMF